MISNLRWMLEYGLHASVSLYLRHVRPESFLRYFPEEVFSKSGGFFLFSNEDLAEAEAEAQKTD